MRSFLASMAICGLVLGTIGCGGGTSSSSGGSTSAQKDNKPAPKEKDIIEAAMANDDFKTLVTAIKAAELVGPLQGEGPFTVFAPTNAAFDKSVPKDKLEELLKPENKDKLAAILKYHVVPAKVMAADALKMDGKEAATLEGSKIKITVKDGSVMVDGAKVVKTDVKCSNGVIHVIDAVIMPKK